MSPPNQSAPETLTPPSMPPNAPPVIVSLPRAVELFIMRVPLSTSTVPLNCASAWIICFFPFLPAIFTLMTVVTSEEGFSVKVPEKSQSTSFVNINFTVLDSKVRELFVKTPRPSRPPIFIKVLVAPGAGFAECQLTVPTLLRRFRVGRFPSDDGVILTTPSIATSGVFSEWATDVSSFHTLKLTTEFPYMLKSPVTVRYLMHADSSIVVSCPILSPAVILHTPAASPPNWISARASSLPILTVPKFTSGWFELTLAEPNASTLLEEPPVNVNSPMLQ